MKHPEALAPLVSSLLARCEARPNLSGVDVLIDLAVFVAAADGRIDAPEQEALASSIQGFSGGQLRAYQISSEILASASANSAAPRAARIAHLANGVLAIDAAEDALRFAAAIALASHGVSPAERAVLDELAAAFRLRPAQLDGILDELRAQLS